MARIVLVSVLFSLFHLYLNSHVQQIFAKYLSSTDIFMVLSSSSMESSPPPTFLPALPFSDLDVPSSGHCVKVVTYSPTLKGEELASRLLAKRAAMGRVVAGFFWHSAKIARLGP